MDGTIKTQNSKSGSLVSQKHARRKLEATELLKYRGKGDLITAQTTALHNRKQTLKQSRPQMTKKNLSCLLQNAFPSQNKN